MPIRPVNPGGPLRPATIQRSSDAGTASRTIRAVKNSDIALPPAEPSADADAHADADDSETRAGPNWTEDGEYIVGKGRTPVHTRWAKGVSGNPKGRRKTAKALDEAVAEFMDRKIKVKTATGDQTATHYDALIRKTFEAAIKGNMTATRMLLERTAAGQAARRATDEPDVGLSQAEQELLQHLLDQDRTPPEDEQ